MTAKERDLEGKILAIVGGDRREQEIARQAVRSGATVRICGFPLPIEGIAGVSVAASPREAVMEAEILLLPLPGMTGPAVFAPDAAEPVIIDQAVLSMMRAGGLVLGGSATAAFEELIAACGLKFMGYEHNEAGRIARAPAIVEGAIARIVGETQRTINGANVVQIGYGVVGRQLAGALRALGARTAIVARSRIRQEEAKACGHLSASDPADVGYLREADLLINTVPARVIDEALLSKIPESCLVLDLASPPGGVEQEAAARTKRRVVWARGLGATSPVSVAHAQWAVIIDLIAGDLPNADGGLEAEA